MIDRDDIARAARYNDALTEEIGFEQFLKRYQIDKDGFLYLADQRALRMAMIYDGRNPNPDPSKPMPVQLTAAARRLLPHFGASWMDGFVTGLLARHDSSHDIPGIDTEGEDASPKEWIVGLTNPPTNLRRFATEAEAVAFVGTLEGVEDGIYYIDPPKEDR